MPRTPRFFACLLSLCLAASACSTIGEPQPSDVAGLYRLDAPGAIQMRVDPRSQTTHMVTAATLDLTPVWLFAVQFQTAESNFGFSGEYSRTPTGIVLEYQSGDVDVGTLSGDQITIVRSDGTTVVFRKIADS